MVMRRTAKLACNVVMVCNRLTGNPFGIWFTNLMFEQIKIFRADVASNGLVECTLLFSVKNRLRFWRCKPAANAVCIGNYTVEKLTATVATMKNNWRLVETRID